MNTAPEIQEIPEMPDLSPEGPQVKPLGAFEVDRVTNGGCLLGNRFLCRGGGLLLVGPSGVGKSTLTLQMGVCWALGLPCLGVKPSGILKGLIIQAENDPGDVAEQRDGIFAGLGLTAAQRQAASEGVRIVSEDSATGSGFIGMAETLLEKERPDLLIIDPLFAYLGADVCDQKAVSAFLRNGLNPLLHRFACGLILAHHSNKPPSGSQKPNWQGSDLSYLGSGTSELSNWARAVLALRAVGSHTVYELAAGKRGRRLGLCDEEGNPIYSQFVKHGTGSICWETCDGAEVPGKRGPKKKYRPEQITDLLHAKEMTTSELRDACKDERGMGKSAFYELFEEMQLSGAVIRSSTSGKWTLKG